MEQLFPIVYVEKPAESAWEIIGRGLDGFNRQQAGDDHAQRLCFAVQPPDGPILGGVMGVVFWDWLYVELMWLEEAARGQGYGSRLLAEIEAEARRRGARHAFLDTFTFQAPEFYKQHGYAVFGELQDFPAGFTRLYMKKELV